MSPIPDYESLSRKKSELIRKGLEGGVIIAPPSAAPITAATLFDAGTGELLAAPSAYGELGWLSTDGAQYSRSVDTSDLTGWGSNEPLRSDTTADTTTLQVTALETNALTLGLFTGTPTADLVPAANGSVEIRKPATPTASFYRVLSIAMDRGDGGEIYLCRFLPRAKVTDYADQSFNNGDDGITYGVTFTGFRDSAFGTSESYLFGGPGWLAMLDDLGFAPAAPAPSPTPTPTPTPTP